MKENNICKFIPVHNSNDTLNTFNFVYERNLKNHSKFILTSVYIMYLVTKGSGFLHTIHRDFLLNCGDLFFTFPSTPFALEKNEDFEYIYISFLGLRANEIFGRLNILKNNPVYKGYDHMIEFWKNALSQSTESNLDLLSESVLLYTFAQIEGEIKEANRIAGSTEIFLKVKKYIDDNYSNANLSLDFIGKTFSYNSKYISNLFKKCIGIGFAEYLQTIRIQHACELMQQGLTTIKNISYLSGYNDPLYFSRVFKSKMGISPKEHLRSMIKESKM